MYSCEPEELKRETVDTELIRQLLLEQSDGGNLLNNNEFESEFDDALSLELLIEGKV